LDTDNAILTDLNLTVFATILHFVTVMW